MLGAPAAGGAEAAPRAVVELFTSPFCSACPEADALFVELARKPDLITLVMPVDSWDRPGRKDALAKPSFTERQAGYADVRHEDALYTPEGGGQRRGAGDGLGRRGDRRGHHADGRGPVGPGEGGNGGAEPRGLRRRGKGGAAGGAMITVLPYVASRVIPMRGGETLRYANLVRDIVPIGTWSGKPLQQTLPLADYAEYDGIVVLLQAGTAQRPGAIIGAARIAFGAKKQGPQAARLSRAPG
ncbi:MAG: DUF1223 domain-containing protein [Hyphomicrobium sp.]